MQITEANKFIKNSLYGHLDIGLIFTMNRFSGIQF